MELRKYIYCVIYCATIHFYTVIYSIIRILFGNFFVVKQSWRYTFFSLVARDTDKEGEAIFVRLERCGRITVMG